MSLSFAFLYVNCYMTCPEDVLRNGFQTKSEPILVRQLPPTSSTPQGRRDDMSVGYIKGQKRIHVVLYMLGAFGKDMLASFPEVLDGLKQIHCRHPFCPRAADEVFLAARLNNKSSMRKAQSVVDWFLALQSLKTDGLLRDPSALMKDLLVVS